jgi:hypothetical protein
LQADIERDGQRPGYEPPNDRVELDECFVKEFHDAPFAGWEFAKALPRRTGSAADSFLSRLGTYPGSRSDRQTRNFITKWRLPMPRKISD